MTRWLDSLIQKGLKQEVSHLTHLALNRHLGWFQTVLVSLDQKGLNQELLSIEFGSEIRVVVLCAYVLTDWLGSLDQKGPNQEVLQIASSSTTDILVGLG